MIYGRQINFMDETALLESKLKQNSDCSRAWMVINVPSANTALFGRNHCEVLGGEELSWYLNRALGIAILKKRMEFYGLDDDTTLRLSKKL